MHAVTQVGEHHRLSFKAITAADLGIYVVKAVNSSGEASVEIKVNIEESAPSMVKKLPRGVNVTGGEILRLEGKVSGQPLPAIKWLKVQ